MIRPASYANGFAPRDGRPLYPSLWKGCLGAWAPCLGPTGLTLRDWSSGRKNGSLLDLPASSAWSVNGGKYSLQFAGASNRVDLGNSISALSGTRACTVAFWARRSTTTSAVTVSNVEGVEQYLAIALWTDGNVYFQVWPSTPSIADNSLGWNHWAMTLTASTLKGYRNGVEVLSAAGPATIPTFTQSLMLGFYGGGGVYSNGFADDLVLYNRAISPAEIRLLASRRGIAYELAPRRRSSAAVQFNRRRRLLIGAGS